MCQVPAHHMPQRSCNHIGRLCYNAAKGVEGFMTCGARIQIDMQEVGRTAHTRAFKMPLVASSVDSIFRCMHVTCTSIAWGRQPDAHKGRARNAYTHHDMNNIVHQRYAILQLPKESDGPVVDRCDETVLHHIRVTLLQHLHHLPPYLLWPAIRGAAIDRHLDGGYPAKFHMAAAGEGRRRSAGRHMRFKDACLSARSRWPSARGSTLAEHHPWSLAH